MKEDGAASVAAPGPRDHITIEGTKTMPTTKRRGVNDASDNGAQRLNVRIDPGAYQRLMIHCVMSGMQPGKFLENLINSHCREWRVQANRSVPVGTDDRLNLDAGVNPGNSMALAG
jgi:hypothetical protein